MELENKKIRISMKMSKVDLYKTCNKLMDANINLTAIIEHLEKQRHGDLIDLLSFSRSLYFVLHNFQPRSHLMEYEEEHGDIPVKKDKTEVGMEVQ